MKTYPQNNIFINLLNILYTRVHSKDFYQQCNYFTNPYTHYSNRYLYAIIRNISMVQLYISMLKMFYC